MEAINASTKKGVDMFSTGPGFIRNPQSATRFLLEYCTAGRYLASRDKPFPFCTCRFPPKPLYALYGASVLIFVRSMLPLDRFGYAQGDSGNLMTTRNIPLHLRLSAYVRHDGTAGADYPNEINGIVSQTLSHTAMSSGL